MADSDKTSAMKQRVVTHMNADHQDSLKIFLEYYCKLPPHLISDAQLDDITLSHLIIRSKAGRNIIPLEPPMESWVQARERMVEMHHASYKGLGRSEITVTEYRPPKTASQISSLAALLVMYYVFSSRRNFQDGSMLHGMLLRHFPGFEQFGYKAQPYVVSVLLIAHIVETTSLVRTRLRRHGIPLGSSLWWKWTVSCFIDGVFSFQRFDGLVREIEEKKGVHKE